MKALALAALERLRDDPSTRSPFAGICECASRLLPRDDAGRRAGRWIRETAAQWPKRTRYRAKRESQGDEHSYPVPGGHAAYLQAEVNGTMWVSEYGQMRRELLDWLIQQAGQGIKPRAAINQGPRVISLSDVRGAPVRIEPRNKARQGNPWR